MNLRCRRSKEEKQARKEKIGDAEDTDSRKANDAMAAEAEAKLIQKQCVESTRITSGKIVLPISPDLT